MIRKAVADDLYPLCEMARRFVNETNLPLTFDEELTRGTFWVAINDDDSILLLDDQDGVLTGAIMGYMERDFCKEYSAYITKLFIEKEFRGLHVSIDLIKAFEQETEKAMEGSQISSGEQKETSSAFSQESYQ